MLQVPWEYLKIGPIYLAGFVAFWTTALITIELHRAKARPGSLRLVVIFMVFSLALTGLSWGLTIYDDAQRAQADATNRLSKVAMRISGLDRSILDKYRATAQNQAVPPEIRDTISGFLRDECGDLIAVAGYANAEAPHNCQNIPPANH